MTYVPPLAAEERQAARDPAGSDRERIFAALEACAGNQTSAARMLGISRRTLLTRLDEHGLP